nr:hypothetical protein Iba_chr04eCG10380 [Ipomoea batatas]
MLSQYAIKAPQLVGGGQIGYKQLVLFDKNPGKKIYTGASGLFNVLDGIIVHPVELMISITNEEAVQCFLFCWIFVVSSPLWIMARVVIGEALVRCMDLACCCKKCNWQGTSHYHSRVSLIPCGNIILSTFPFCHNVLPLLLLFLP